MTIKRKFTVFVTVLMLWSSCFGQTYIPVTEYDAVPEEVFTDSNVNVKDRSGERPFPSPFQYIISLKKNQYEVNLDQVIDWETFWALNQEGFLVYQNLVHCSNQDGVSDHRLYWDTRSLKQICPVLFESLRRWKQQVFNFYRTTAVGSVVFENLIQCPKASSLPSILCSRPSYNKAHRLTWTEGELQLTQPDQWGEWPIRDFKINEVQELYDLFSHIDHLSIHPLLVQVSLEILALGYPLPFGTYSCKGKDCFRDRFLFFAKRPIAVAHRGHSPDPSQFDRGLSPIEILSVALNREGKSIFDRIHMDTTIRGAQDVIDKNTLAPLDKVIEEIGKTQTQSSEAFVSLSQYRASKAVARTLFILSLFDETSSFWGLWPQASFDLMSTLAQTYFTDRLGENLNDDLADWILLSMSRQMEMKVPPRRITVGSSMNMTELARVGAWRRLWEEPTEGGVSLEGPRPSDKEEFGLLGAYED